MPEADTTLSMEQLCNGTLQEKLALTGLTEFCNDTSEEDVTTLSMSETGSFNRFIDISPPSPKYQLSALTSTFSG